MDFFLKHFLEAYRGADRSPRPSGPRCAANWARIVEELAAEPRVLCHRDYHSRNLMLKEGRLYIIDFQDARMGPDTYDLVSLLRDSYVDISERAVEDLIAYFLALKGAAGHEREFRQRFDVMALQRNLKALGTFGYQTAARQNPVYIQYIPRTHALRARQPRTGTRASAACASCWRSTSTRCADGHEALRASVCATIDGSRPAGATLDHHRASDSRRTSSTTSGSSRAAPARPIAAHGFSRVELFATRRTSTTTTRRAVEALGRLARRPTGLSPARVHAPIVEGYVDGVVGRDAVERRSADAGARGPRTLKETRGRAAASPRASRTSYLVVHLGQPDAQSPPPNDNQRDAARRSVEELARASPATPACSWRSR